MRRAMLIYNPTAGQIWSHFAPETAKEYLSKHEWNVSIFPTQRIGGGTDLARKAVSENYDVVIVAGGDGTINEAVQGLAHTSVKLGILPVGTTNVLARELKIPLNYHVALEYLPIAKTISVDLGCVNNHYFLLMAGIGLDAQVVQAVKSTTKHYTGIVAFVTASIKALLEHKPVRVKISLLDVEGKQRILHRTISQILVSNAATYGTDFVVAEEARFDDGLLELHLFKCRQLKDTAQSFLALLLGKHKEWSDLEHYSFTTMQIKSKYPCPIQVDGESIAYTPAKIEVIPHALNLLSPKSIIE